jgi:glycosyltransferase involved in cell wall biosynthesis
MLSNPLVSFCVVTYNHEEYIYQSLLSIINCNYNFKYEIIIGNDKSTDQTSSEILRFQRDYPDIHVVHVNREINVGTNKNYLDLFSKSNGKYLLLLDGDDFLDFNDDSINLNEILLNSNSCVAFSYKFFYEDKKEFEKVLIKDISLEKSLDGLFFHMSSIFFPKWIVDDILNYHWLDKYNFLDRPLQINFIRDEQKLLFPDTFMSVYRMHSNSQSKKMNSLQILDNVTHFLVDYYRHYKKSLKNIEKRVFKKRLYDNYMLILHPKNILSFGRYLGKLKNDFVLLSNAASYFFAWRIALMSLFLFPLKKFK